MSRLVNGLSMALGGLGLTFKRLAGGGGLLGPGESGLLLPDGIGFIMLPGGLGVLLLPGS